MHLTGWEEVQGTFIGSLLFRFSGAIRRMPGDCSSGPIGEDSALENAPANLSHDLSK